MYTLCKFRENDKVNMYYGFTPKDDDVDGVVTNIDKSSGVVTVKHIRFNTPYIFNYKGEGLNNIYRIRKL